MDGLGMRATNSRENNRGAETSPKNAKRTQAHRTPVIATDMSDQKAQGNVHLENKRHKIDMNAEIGLTEYIQGPMMRTLHIQPWSTTQTAS